MRIGIDFDRVLFDTDSFDRFYKEEVDGLRHVEDPAPVTDGCYDPELHAELCGVNKEEIWKFFSHDLSRFLYDDLDELDKLEDHQLILVTRGNHRFQMEKVKASGTEELVDEVHVVQQGSKDQIDIDILADDSREELEQLSVPGVLISRPEEGLEKLVEEVERYET